MTAVLEPVDDFTEFYRAQQGPMLRLACSMTGRRAVAEELVQDAFAKLHTRWATIDVPAAYLRTMVVNACRSWHRREARERVRNQQYHCVTTTQLGARELVDVVAALPPAQRAAITLRYYEGRSEEEISRALGCAPATVRTNVFRGLRNMRRAVEA